MALKRPALAIVALSLISGCAGIVRKPAVDTVKKVALVSVYTNKGVYSLDGGGGITSLVSMMSDNNAKAADDFDSQRVADFALQIWTEELSKVKSWSLVPYSVLQRSPAYQKFVADRANAGLLGNNAAFTVVPATGMRDINLSGLGTGDNFKRLKDLCADLKVDAVAVAQVDNAYSASISFGGSGTARASVGTTLKIINRNGELAVVTPDNGGMRSESSKTTALILGNIRFNAEVEEMYRMALVKNATMIREEINKKM